MKKRKSAQSVPVCRFCGGSFNTQFAIFNPRFQPFGTACVECEKIMPEGITPPMTGLTLAERFAGTVPVFREQIAKIGTVAKLPPLAVFALYRKYSDDCNSADQSAILGEFVEWCAPRLGGDRPALHQALQDRNQPTPTEPAAEDDRAAGFDAELKRLLAGIEKSARAQFEYNETVNIPEGIVAPAESLDLALRSGMASGWNNFNRYDCEPAIELAHAILEDANCHTEARAIAPSLIAA